MTQEKIAIVGAGMAGLACASRLVQLGFAVTVFDKARGPGGRMSTRRVQTLQGEVLFDHGAQYFTARDPAFVEQVRKWSRSGVVAPWPAAGPEAWVGTPAMNSPVRALAETCDVRWSVRVEALETGAGHWDVLGAGGPWCGFDAVVVAVPAEQAATLLRPLDVRLAAHADSAKAAPCWTLMVSFAERLPIPVDTLRGHEVVGWAARNSAKPQRTGPESWVVQATPEWSQGHLESDGAEVAALLLSAFASMQGVPLASPVSTSAHRWRYARYPQAPGGAGRLLWNPQLRLGTCGDWLTGPRVECAFLSGRDLAEAIARSQ